MIHLPSPMNAPGKNKDILLRKILILTPEERNEREKTTQAIQWSTSHMEIEKNLTL